jgi:hypothetical protein
MLGRRFDMFVRITVLRFDLAREGDVTRLTNEEIIPAFRKLAGFRHYYGSVDRATGHGYSITLWDTREQAEALRTALGGTIMQRLLALGVQLDPPQIQEIIAQA